MNSQTKTLRLALTILLIAYWLAMFVGTHIPRVPQGLMMPGGDKIMHLVAYAGLAFLIAFHQLFGSSFNWKRAAVVFGIVALYGVVDELSQIPVGRDADLYDWFADITGAMIGLALLATLKAVVEWYAVIPSLSRDQTGSGEKSSAKNDAVVP
jgi:VanZ family protein